MAVCAVVILAIVVAIGAATQAARGYFHQLTPVDFAVIVAMLILGTLIGLAKVSVPRMTFDSVFSVSGAIFVATTIGYGAIIGIIVAAISTIVTELFARRVFQKLVFNVANMIATAGLAGITYQALVGDTTHVPLASTTTAIAALIASLVYLAMNNGLFSIVVGTATGRSPITVFLANSRGQLLQNITLPPIGLLLTTVRELSPLTVLIALIPLLERFAKL